jgi:hypothetical protein
MISAAAASPETSRFSVHWPSSSGRLLLVCQELADERHQTGIDLIDWRAALVLSDQQPGSTAWHFGHVCGTLGHELRDSGAELDVEDREQHTGYCSGQWRW